MIFVDSPLSLALARQLLLVASVLCVGCSQERSAQQAAGEARSNSTEAPAAIAWFEGSVEEAFAAAAAAPQPLFLYWGARWCPPCNQLKSTVFTRRDFVAQTRDYVAYRLDGDDPAAQRWAAHFGAMGYPTLIVFDSQGQELTRLSSGMQLERYAKVLKSAPQARNLTTLIALWRQGRLAEWTAADWEQVAYYPWGAEADGVLEAAQRRTFFGALYASGRVPTPALGRRLSLLWASEHLRSSERAPLSAARQRSARQELQAVLQARAEWAASLGWLQYNAVDWIAAVTTPGQQREDLLRSLESVMDQVWAQTDFGLRVRLLTLRSHLDAYSLQHPQQPIPADLVHRVEQRTAAIVASAQTAYERQSLLYNAAWYLHEVGQTQAAAKLLQAELDTAVAAHYYMSYLGHFARAQGDQQEALRWYQQAFEEAHGAATRMQWGLAYLSSLLELAPENDARIFAALDALSQIAEQSPDSLYQRSRVRLERLQAPLAAWAQASERRGEPLAAARSQWQRACRALDAGSPAAQACAGFWPST